MYIRLIPATSCCNNEDNSVCSFIQPTLLISDTFSAPDRSSERGESAKCDPSMVILLGASPLRKAKKTCVLSMASRQCADRY